MKEIKNNKIRKSGGGGSQKHLSRRAFTALCLLTCMPATYAASLSDTTLGDNSAYNLTERADYVPGTVTKYEINNVVRTATYTDKDGNTQTVNYNVKQAVDKYFDLKYNIATGINNIHEVDSPFDNTSTNNPLTLNSDYNDGLNQHFVGNFPGWQGSYNNGGAINNDNHKISSITGDFVRNYMIWDNVQGGAIYNNGSEASIGAINGDFVQNVVFTNKDSAVSAKGGAIFNAGGAKIESITAQFIGNYTEGTSNYTQGGAIYNASGAQIGDINGDFLGNYVHVKGDSNTVFYGDGNGAAGGGAIYNIEDNTSIGNITGNFINNYVQNDGWHSAQGGAIYNTAKMGSIEGSFINNYTTTNYRNAEGGAIYNLGSLAEGGNIKGDFVGNYVTSYHTQVNNGEHFAQGGAIYNNGSSAKIGDIEGNFVDNYAKIVDADNAYQAKGGAIFNAGGAEIGNITGSFIGNYAQGTEKVSGSSYKAQGGAIANISGAKIGNIIGDFVDNHAIGGEWTTSFGGAIYNDEGASIGDIISKFIANNSSMYGGAIVNFGGATINSIKADYISNNSSLGYYLPSSSGYESTYSGGGAILNGTDSIITNGIEANFVENAGSYGGAINNHGTIGGVIKGDFVENTSYNRGGAIWNNGSIGAIIGNFIKNSASSYGAAVFNSNGGVIDSITSDYIEGNSGKSVISNVGEIKNITANFVNNNMDTNSGSRIIVNSNDSAYGSDTNRIGAQKIGTISGSFVNNTVNSHIITNTGTIDAINADFDKNKSSNSIIFNSSSNNSVINGIEGNFTNNRVGSVVIFNSGTIDGTIKGDFINNSFTSSYNSATIYNSGTINAIEGNFQNNADFNARAINNEYTTSLIKSIVGNFTGNGVTSYGGGAIANKGVIETLRGDFVDNYLKVASSSYGTVIQYGGGAIYNDGTISEIVNSTFKNNTVISNGYEARGGAIYNSGKMNIIATDGYTSVIEGNTVKDALTSEMSDNAIYLGNQMTQLNYNYLGNGSYEYKYNTSVATLDLTAENGGTFLINDKISGAATYEGDWIYHYSNSQADYYYVDADGNKIDTPNINNYTLNFKGDETGTVILNNDVTSEIYDPITKTYSEGGQADINLYLVTLKLGKRDNVLDGNNMTAYSGAINMINNQVGVSALNSLTLKGDTKFYADVDLAQEQMDRFVTNNNYGEHEGNLIVSGMNIISDMDQSKDEILIPFAEKGLKDYVIDEVGGVPGDYQTDFYTPIYRYKLGYETDDETGYYRFIRGAAISGGGSGNPSENFNPAVLATPVGMQAGAQAAINETFKYSFHHADSFSKLPSLARFAQMNGNKYAITDFNNNMPIPEAETKGFWTTPYTTFESINLKNGPSVDAITYGSLFGFDTDIREMKNGWKNVFTGYLGYNGSHLNYNHVSTNMNGGMLGFTETFYKKNFWTALTMTAGASVGEAHTMYGKDDFTSLLGGIGSKTGYNLEFKGGRYIIQPIMFLSYTFVNTFDYTNAAGVKIDSDPLHTVQINPSVRFIGNFENGWQPYATVGMVWNLLNDTKVTANNIRLPEMSIKPYVEYGVGVQRNWADKFTAYGQALIRNGGRNGIALSGGFRWALGSPSKGREKHPLKENI